MMLWFKQDKLSSMHIQWLNGLCSCILKLVSWDTVKIILKFPEKNTLSKSLSVIFLCVCDRVLDSKEKPFKTDHCYKCLLTVQQGNMGLPFYVGLMPHRSFLLSTEDTNVSYQRNKSDNVYTEARNLRCLFHQCCLLWRINNSYYLGHLQIIRTSSNQQAKLRPLL